jgi:hypothetical protein
MKSNRKSVESLAGLLLFFLMSTTLSFAQLKDEPRDGLQLRDFLEESQIKGELYRIDDKVTSDGFWNIYTMESEFGTFVVHGTALLRERIQEIAAIAELRRQDEVVLVAQGAGEWAVDTGKSLYRVARHPDDTVEGIGPGVQRVFGQIQRGLHREQEKSEKGKEDQSGESSLNIDQAGKAGVKISEMVLSVPKYKRRWAKELGVDPYSRNPLLQRELEKVAFLEASGHFAAGVAAPVPMPVGIAVRVSDVVWNEDPDKIETLNESRLREIGVSEVASRNFRLNEYFTLTRQTYFVEMVHKLRHVDGIVRLVEMASLVDSEELAVFFTECAQMMEVFDRQESKLIRMISETPLVAALVEGNRVVDFFPADYVFWTRELEQRVSDVSQILSKSYPDAQLEVWMTGRASERTRGHMGSLGLTLRENVQLFETSVD